MPEAVAFSFLGCVAVVAANQLTEIKVVGVVPIVYERCHLRLRRRPVERRVRHAREEAALAGSAMSVDGC